MALCSDDVGEEDRVGGTKRFGKSSFMKLLAGQISPDAGSFVRSGDIRVAMLFQDVPDDLPGTVCDVVASGSQEHVGLLSEYHELTFQISHGGDDSLIKKLEDAPNRRMRCLALPPEWKQYLQKMSWMGMFSSALYLQVSSVVSFWLWRL